MIDEQNESNPEETWKRKQLRVVSFLNQFQFLVYSLQFLYTVYVALSAFALYLDNCTRNILNVNIYLNRLLLAYVFKRNILNIFRANSLEAMYKFISIQWRGQ